MNTPDTTTTRHHIRSTESSRSPETGTGHSNPYIHQHVVSAGYFATMGLRVVSGRGFAEADREETQPVTIVSAALARRLWPDGDPIGRRLVIGTESPTNPWMTVVGVAADIRHTSPRSVEYDVYRLYRQSWAGGSWFVARVDRGDAAALMSQATRLVGAVDQDQSYFDATPLDTRVRRLMWREQLASQLVAAFGLVAAMLAVVGLAGLVGYTVRQRRREIGVRLALGASQQQVMRTLLSEVLVLVSIGVLVGGAALLVIQRLFGYLLFEPTWADYTIMLGRPVGLALVAIGVAWVTAWRGSRIPLADVLRA